MIRDKEKLIQEKTEKIAQRVKTYVDEMDTLSDGDGFTIDTMEEKWDELDRFTRKLYKEINDEIVSQLDERRIIASKKGSTRRKG